MLPRAYAQAYCTNGIPCHQPQSAKPLTRAVEHVGQQGQAVCLAQVSSGAGDSAEAGRQMDGEQNRAAAQRSQRHSLGKHSEGFAGGTLVLTRPSRNEQTRSSMSAFIKCLLVPRTVLGTKESYLSKHGL